MLLLKLLRCETRKFMPQWWKGRHEGLKIPWPVMAVRVRIPLRALRYKRFIFLKRIIILTDPINALERFKSALNRK